MHVQDSSAEQDREKVKRKDFIRWENYVFFKGDEATIFTLFKTTLENTDIPKSNTQQHISLLKQMHTALVRKERHAMWK